MSSSRQNPLALLLPGSTPVTTLMLMFNIGFFALIALQSGGLDINPYNLWRAGANDHALVVTVGEPWRLITYAFLHAGVLHILFNCYVLAVVGPLVENRFGSPRMAIIYVVAAIAGGVASAYLTDGYSIGASGAVTGIMGAGIVVTHAEGTEMALRIRNQLIFWIALTTLIGLAMSTGGGSRVDHFAHFGGLAAGAGFGALFVRNPKSSGRTFQLEAVIGTLLVVGSIGAMVGHQIWVKDIPTLDRRSQAALEAVERQMRSACFDALDGRDLADAIAPCRAFQFPDYTQSSVQLVQSIHEALGNSQRARRQERILMRVLDGRPVPFADVPAEERIELIRMRIEHLR